MDQLDQSGQIRSNDRSWNIQTGPYFYFEKRSERSGALLQTLAPKHVHYGSKKHWGWTITNRRSRSSPYILGLLWLFVWVSDINSNRWPPQPAPQLSSSWTWMCSNSSTIAIRAKKTILRQVYQRLKMTLATGRWLLMLFWNGMNTLGQVWVCSDKITRMERNPDVTTVTVWKHVMFIMP